jgi:NAD(P)H dehydrogenase (quinone)
MRVHIVYAHPSDESFTHAVLQAFLTGVADAGGEATMSDLYAMGFRSELSLEEYLRGYNSVPEDLMPSDVAAERDKLLAANAWAFVYPVWWTDCPAILKGWFDRVWTGFERPFQEMPIAVKALVLCTAGHTVKHLMELGEYQAMKTVMLTDRIAHRAGTKQFHVFDGSAALHGQDWAIRKTEHLAKARQLGYEAVTG